MTKAKRFAAEIGADGFFMTSVAGPAAPHACPGVTEVFDTVIRIGVQPRAPRLTKARQVGAGPPDPGGEGKRKKKGVIGSLRGSFRGSRRNSKAAKAKKQRVQ